MFTNPTMVGTGQHGMHKLKCLWLLLKIINWLCTEEITKILVL